MTRENSISDEADNRSLTSEDVPGSPKSTNSRQPKLPKPHQGSRPTSLNGDLPCQEEITICPSTSAAPTPGDRFRAAIRKVMKLRRTTSWIAGSGIGAEPGVDPRRESASLAYGHIRDKCVIEICDFSAVRSNFKRMTNRAFVDMMDDPIASAKEPWVKVRWINIGGISWDVLGAVGLKYDLHPLALEDVLYSASRKRSKADYYTHHLYLCILCHSLSRDNEFIPMNATTLSSATLTNLPRSASPLPFNEKDLSGTMGLADDAAEEHVTCKTPNPTPRKKWRQMLADLEKGSPVPLRWSGLRALQKEAAREERVKEEISIQAFKKGDRVEVKVDPISLFLTRDGTVVSIHPKNDLNFTSPIAARIRHRDTVLRASADPSLLVEAIIDLIVDQTLEVVDEYQGKILKLEHEVLLKPKVKTIRSLHILSGDLVLHKRTIEPVKTVIYGLRRYDVDRCAALIDPSNADANTKVQGFMSHKAKIYLADVYDHTEYILTSLDMCAGISQNLINYSFNMASHDMNEVMRRLTLATIIFLPLTLLTGYFGMNFPNMWSLHGQGGHSDVVFWVIALPIMSIILPIFLREDIVKMTHYIKKNIAVQNAVKSYKSA